MRTAVPDDQITEMAVLRNENPPLAETYREDLRVLEVAGIIPPDPGGVMATSTEVSDAIDIGTGIDDELHERSAAPTNPLRLLSLSSRSRAVRA